MSLKSTLFSTPRCHIYSEYAWNDDGTVDLDRPTLCIEVSYEHIGEDSNYIEVEWDSDFSVMIRALLEIADHDQLDKLCRENWSKRNHD